MANEGSKPHKAEYSDAENNNSHIIFSSDDQRLKILGQIFGNKTSRDIVAHLIEEELTAMQISDKLDIKLNLVLYHLNKMMELQIISVTKTTKNSRGHQVKHYRAKQAVMIFSKNAKDRANKSKTLSDSVKRVIKFSAIGIAGAVTWFVTHTATQWYTIVEYADSALKYPRPTLRPYMAPIDPQSLSLPEIFMPMIAGITVVVSLLLIDRRIISRINLHRKQNSNKKFLK